jgi:hypothetical protein
MAELLQGGNMEHAVNRSFKAVTKERLTGEDFATLRASQYGFIYSCLWEYRAAGYRLFGVLRIHDHL